MHCATPMPASAARTQISPGLPPCFKPVGGAIVGEPRQIRTWNLSSIWRLPTTLGTAWLKVVPPFFAHEAGILAALAEAPVPRLLGHDRGRMLLANIDGSDRYDAAPSECLTMIDLLVSIQRDWLGRAEELLCLGAPDWRGPALSSAIGALVARRADELGPGVRGLLEEFVADLPARFAAIAACGLSDGLVHGDFHPGNFRGTSSHLILLDWGDSGIGHPLLDQTAFLDRIPETQGEAARQHWTDAWQQAVPGADVETASQLLAPIAAARQAVIYQRFLDAIEDSEHAYHRADVGIWLQRTANRLTSDQARRNNSMGCSRPLTLTGPSEAAAATSSPAAASTSRDARICDP